MIRNAVVAALIRNSEGRVYLQQRCEGKSYAGKWELPRRKGRDWRKLLKLH